MIINKPLNNAVVCRDSAKTLKTQRDCFLLDKQLNDTIQSPDAQNPL